jgi:hypothetical protein
MNWFRIEDEVVNLDRVCYISADLHADGAILTFFYDGEHCTKHKLNCSQWEDIKRKMGVNA